MRTIGFYECDRNLLEIALPDLRLILPEDRFSLVPLSKRRLQDLLAAHAAQPNPALPLDVLVVEATWRNDKLSYAAEACGLLNGSILPTELPIILLGLFEDSTDEQDALAQITTQGWRSTYRESVWPTMVSPSSGLALWLAYHIEHAVWRFNTDVAMNKHRNSGEGEPVLLKTEHGLVVEVRLDLTAPASPDDVSRPMVGSFRNLLLSWTEMALFHAFGQLPVRSDKGMFTVCPVPEDRFSSIKHWFKGVQAILNVHAAVAVFQDRVSRAGVCRVVEIPHPPVFRSYAGMACGEYRLTGSSKGPTYDGDAVDWSIRFAHECKEKGCLICADWNCPKPSLEKSGFKCRGRDVGVVCKRTKGTRQGKTHVYYTIWFKEGQA